MFCYLRMLKRWIIRRKQVYHDGCEAHGEQRFQLMKDETEVIAEFNITEIREIKNLFLHWEDPYERKDTPPTKTIKSI